MESECTYNRGLFSDHYLATRLPEQPEWEGDYGPLRDVLERIGSGGWYPQRDP